MDFYTNFYMRGDAVNIRGYRDGKRFNDRIEYNPVLYIPGNPSSHVNWRSVDGDMVNPVNIGSISEARGFVKRYEGVEGFKVHGSTAYDYVCINENYGKDYDPEQIRVVCIDIEVASADGFPEPALANQPVTAITMSFKGHYYVFGVGAYKVKADNVSYTDCGSEKSLLNQFIRFWRKIDADIVTGWNVQFFDIPYLYNRMCNTIGPTEAKYFSPTRIVKERMVKIHNREHQSYELVGITVMDYLEMYKKFTYSQQESYRLDNIAHVELGERKLDYSEVETLHQLYELDYDKFIDYNIKDVEIVNNLEEKMKLLEMAIALAYDAKVNYKDVFTQVKMWDTLIHNYLMESHIVVPPKENSAKDSQFEGAYVKTPQVGMHEWIMSFDLNSLYPHLIMQYNISPETFVKHEYANIGVNEILAGKFPEMDEDLCMAANGRFFEKHKQGFLPEMMQNMYDTRVIAKKKMLEAQTNLEEVNRRLNNG